MVENATKASDFGTGKILPIRRVLIAATNNTGLVQLAHELIRYEGIKIISTGRSGKTLKDGGIVKELTLVRDVGELSKILAEGILERKVLDYSKLSSMTKGFEPIDMVVCNFYELFKTAYSVEKGKLSPVELAELGIPQLAKQAAKDYTSAFVVPSTRHYPALVHQLLKLRGKITEGTRRDLAAEASMTVDLYEKSIAVSLSSRHRKEMVSLRSQPSKQAADAKRLESNYSVVK